MKCDSLFLILLVNVCQSVRAFKCFEKCPNCENDMCQVPNTSFEYRFFPSGELNLLYKCENPSNIGLQLDQFVNSTGSSFANVMKLNFHMANCQISLEEIMAKFVHYSLGEGLKDFIFSTPSKTTIGADLFRGLEGIQSLRLNGAKLTFNIKDKSPLIKLKNLTDLHMRALKFHEDQFNQAIFVGLDSLQSLSFLQVVVPNITGNAIAPLTNLKSLVLERFSCPFPDDFFSSLSSLKDLRIKKDECFSCPDSKRLMRRSFFQNLTSLHSFEYVGQHQDSESKITEFQPGVFLTNAQLQNLNLSGVELPNNDLSVFSDLKQLRNLVLIAPKLSRFDPTHLSVHSLKVTLTQNQYGNASCPFLRNISHFSRDVDVELAVKGSHGIRLIEPIADSIDTLCKVDTKWNWAILPTSLFALLIVSCVILLIIGACFCCLRGGKTYAQTADFDDFSNNDQCDVFISYANEDNDAAGKIVSLFKKHNITYINHEEHFQVGDPIVENIERAVRTSRITLIILSSHYLQSPWCIHELETAQTFDKKVVILYRGNQSLTEQDFIRTPKLHELIRTQTYLSESEDFLERLTKVVKTKPVISKYSKNRFRLPTLGWTWFKSTNPIPVSTELGPLS